MSGTKWSNGAAWLARHLGDQQGCLLDTSDMEALESHVSAVTKPPGSVLQTAGKAPASVWVVRDGCIELCELRSGRWATAELLCPGRTIGDTDAILGCRSAHTARVLVQADLVTLSTQAFLLLLADRPRIAHRWLQNMSRELSDSRRRISSIMGQSLTARAAQLLLDTAASDAVGVSQAKLAEVLGVRRGTFNRLLRELADKNLVEAGYRQIRLKDPAALQRMARDGD